MNSTLLIKIILSCLILALTTELVSRNYGLNNYPLFQESKEFEYIHKPNQHVKIYGNTFITNNFSMRSEALNSDDSLVVLLIGDSVVNGGNQVSHEELASTLLENKLSDQLKKKVRVLNISSFTWGPDNIYAYLKKYGLFNADLLVMVNNSGDAYDNMTFKKVVGVKPNFPENNYALASMKLLEKCFNTLANKVHKYNPIEKEAKSLTFNSGFENINTLAKQAKIPLLIYMHASQQELANKKFTEDGELIIDFFKSNKRDVIQELQYPMKSDYYLDEIHLNSKGQLFMSSVLFKPIYKIMSEKINPHTKQS